MGYVKAGDVLPQKLIDQIQAYVEGETIYIPRRASSHRAWGENTPTRELLRRRNQEIFESYLQGVPVERLSQRYYLSPKSIQKILARCRREIVNSM